MSSDGLAAVLGRLRRNVGLLSVGAAVTMVFGVATLAFNARALRPEAFGVLALVQSYAVVMNRVFGFDVWQGIIRFGAEAQERHSMSRLRAVCSFALLFDFASALAAGAVGLLILFVVPSWLKVPADSLWPAAVYVATLFVQLPGAPVGLMRFFNKFHWLTVITVLESGARLAAAALLYLEHASLGSYLLAYAAILLAFNGVRIVTGLWLVKRATGSWALASTSDMRPIVRQFVRFSAGSWITGTLNVSRRDGTTLIVAALLGPAGAGFYAVGQRVVRPLRDVAELIRQAAFPEISRMAAGGSDAEVGTLVRRMLRLTLPLAALLSILGLLLGRFVIRIAAGAGYEQAYWPFVWLVCAASLYLCTPILSSVAILYSGMKRYVLSTLVAAAVWAIALVPPMLVWGVAGAGVAEALFVAVWIVSNVTELRHTARGARLMSAIRSG